MPVRTAVLGLATFLVIAFYLTSLQRDAYAAQFKCPSPPPAPSPPPKLTPEDALATLFSTIKHPSMKSKYIDADGNTFKAMNDMLWKEPLGQKLLILDVSTRLPPTSDDIFGLNKLSWAKIQSKADDGSMSAASLNHFMYAQIHGYAYVYYQADAIPGHHDSWVKPHVLQEMLQSYDYVVMIDSDATIQHLEVPLEWLFNRWGITPSTSIAMPVEAKRILKGDGGASIDSKGRLTLNTGFIVAHRSSHTVSMLEAWASCTSQGSPYPKCSKLKQAGTFEQHAFSEYIRYDYNPTGKEIVEIPCDDAMGFPGLKKSNKRVLTECRGQFVRHHSAEKGLTKGSAGDAALQSLAEVLQASLKERKWEYYVNEASDNELTAGDLRAS